MSTALDDLTQPGHRHRRGRVGTQFDWVAPDLFEVERSLGEASRRLGTVMAGLAKRR